MIKSLWSLNVNEIDIEWHGNKFWRFYYDFEEERLIWEDKENLRNVNEKLEEKTENTRLNSVNSRT